MAGLVLFTAVALEAPPTELTGAELGASDVDQAAARSSATDERSGDNAAAQAPSSLVSLSESQIQAEGPAPAESEPSGARENDGPPYYSEDDVRALRARYGIASVDAKPPRTSKAKRVLRCLVADPICAFNVEINATSAYAYRARQGDVSGGSSTLAWNSGRAQYDLWINFGVGNQIIGRKKYTTVTFGPKGGIITSDSSDMWGNVGFAMRAWLGRGSWAPTVELSSALTFRIRGERAGEVRPYRSPPGVTADLGLGVGGWGAIIFGGQFDPPLAQEDVPEQVRISSAGMFFVGFRGNIVWGVPAGAAIGTQAAVSRSVNAP